MKLKENCGTLKIMKQLPPKIEHKPVTKPEYRSLGMQPFSPIDNKKQISEVLVTSQFNKDKGHDPQKVLMTNKSLKYHLMCNKILHWRIHYSTEVGHDLPKVEGILHLYHLQ